MNIHKLSMIIMGFLWLILAVIGILFFLRILSGGSCPFIGKGSFLFQSSKNSIVEEFTFDATNINTLSIDLISESIRIEKSFDDSIRVKISSTNVQEQRPKAFVEKESLQIKRGKIAFFLFRFGWFNEYVEVSLPSSLFEKKDFRINAYSTSGSIQASHIQAKHIDLRSTSGSIAFNDLKAQEIIASSTSGSLKAEEAFFTKASLKSTSGSIVFDGSCDEAEFQSTSGSVRAAFSTMPKKNSTFSSTSGSVRVSLPENEGFEFVYSTVSGSARNDFTSLRSSKRGSERYKNGGVLLHLSSTSGSVRIEKN